MSQINVNQIFPLSSNAVEVGNVAIKSGNNSVTLGMFNNLTTIGSFNTGLGIFALQLATGTSNTAVGYNANRNLTSGSYNTAFGGEALRDTTTGTYNTSVGHNSGTQITTGVQNATFGSGTGNVISTGNGNTVIGTFAGGITTGNGNTVVGYQASASSFTVDNEITLGGYSTVALRCNVTSITSLSDARDKKDVTDLRAGLDFVKGLRPVEFVWDDREEHGKHDIADFGFIAQDLKAAQEDADMADVLKLVYESNPEKLEASYGKLIPILVKAIQDLAAKVEQLEK